MPSVQLQTPKNKPPQRNITGLLLLDKPAGLSSNTAVGRVKRLFAAAKAGHTGTLDPFATGLLPVTLGEAAKYSRFLLDSTKGYVAELRLGVTTTTGDPEGAILTQSAVNVGLPQIESVLERFVGTHEQVPPMYSALKRDGVPLYKLARQGIEVERSPRAVTIEHLSLQHWDGKERLLIEVTCSKGTYIRVLAEDIGRQLGCGAYLTGLRRTHVGGLGIESAVTFEALELLEGITRDQLLKPAQMLAMSLPALNLDDAGQDALGNGRKHLWTDSAPSLGEHRLFSAQGAFMGIGILMQQADGIWLAPVRMMSAAAYQIST